MIPHMRKLPVPPPANPSPQPSLDHVRGPASRPSASPVKSIGVTKGMRLLACRKMGHIRTNSGRTDDPLSCIRRENGLLLYVAGLRRVRCDFARAGGHAEGRSAVARP